MGFLHKLWDETLAGPTPESGLGKLRKYNSFSGTRSAADPSQAVVAPDDRLPQISRSITIIRNSNNSAPASRNLNVSVDSPSAPSSPASCSTPTSPFSPSTPGGNFKKLTRRKCAAADPKSPHGYDWFVSSLSNLHWFNYNVRCFIHD
ncbi:auxin-repressed 12.5 kDa protein [Dorcoceras hygrometricum]|uniref:Auxin-repressed 12.5 kDa protein n=1 Tax=Dorcoceras hygrometricum TaxID=472368 RepID=A0A2Z7B1C6_9LAMI|nr:auxin-repressed 12.5 kDa protein [Dorcoceras hygrometricum]